MKKRAFTLAEVLITLGIIGVVAALVMPTLIANYQKKVTVAKLKKEYSDLNNVLHLSNAQNGPTSNWEDWPNAFYGTDEMLEWLTKYITPYVKTVKLVDTYKADQAGIARRVTLSGLSPMYSTYYIVKEDGTIWGFEPAINNGTGVRIYVYVKNPKGRYAVIGKDVFAFVIYKSDTQIVKAWGQGHTRDELKADGVMPHSSPSNELPNAGSCNENGSSHSYVGPGTACSALIMLDGWEIRSDYPW